METLFQKYVYVWSKNKFFLAEIVIGVARENFEGALSPPLVIVAPPPKYPKVFKKNIGIIV